MWRNARSRAVVLGLVFILGGQAVASPPAERPAAVAGQFYPGDCAALTAAVVAAMAEASAPLGERPVALVAPHAGYVYCGGVLAEAWRQAQPHRYDLIVLLGTNHTTAGLEQAAVWTGGAWRTPLGVAAVDAEAAAALVAAAGSDATTDPAPHGREHSIEVQVPFAQRLFPGVKILPVIVGSEDPSRCERFGKALAAVVRDRRALIVASSDLSHYPSRADAEVVDRAVLAAITSLDPGAVQKTIGREMGRGVRGLGTCACGEAPILVAMVAARALGASRGTVIRYANSGYVPHGDRDRVVGYGVVAFTAGGAARKSGSPAVGSAPSAAIPPADRRHLLAVARAAIAAELGPPAPLEPCYPNVMIQRGAFVTLKESGELRGCIGHLAADRPLCSVVEEMALRAAFADHRFSPLGREELDAIAIEISVLTPAEPVSGPEAIVVGRDGVILKKNGRSAVFLPQVAIEQGWDRDTMLSHLARKAGLPADAWREGATLLTFQAEVFAEDEMSPVTPAPGEKSGPRS